MAEGQDGFQQFSEEKQKGTLDSDTDFISVIIMMNTLVPPLQQTNPK